MPYAAGVDHDFFLSYAHGNDLLRAWSLRVETKLRGSLEILLGDRERKLSVFTDSEDLQGNGFLSPQLKRGVESSAAIIIILTHHYTRSPWCRQEAAWFASVARDAADRIFVIRAQNVAPADWPEPLKLNGEPMLGYAFCDEDEAALPYGLHGQQEQQLDGAVVRLSKAMFHFLRSRRPPPPRPAATPGSKDRPRVFLGFATEDLEPERASLADRLSADGTFDVDAPAIPEDVEEIHDRVARAAEECSALVQLCGRASGRWKRSADGYIAGQIRVFESKRRPLWLARAANLDLARLPSSPYADFLAARAERLGPEPTVADLRSLLTAAESKASAIACTIFIQSRQSYASVEQRLRQKLHEAGKASRINARLLPLPPIYATTNPRQIEALLEQRSQRAVDIQAEILLLTENRELLGEDLDEYWRDSSSGAATWPAAIIDATTDGPVMTEADMGHPVFRLEDPAFGASFADWLRQCAAQRVAP